MVNESHRQVGWISRHRGEQAIARQESGWPRLFACWDICGDGQHFHLATRPQREQARSFTAQTDPSRTMQTAAVHTAMSSHKALPEDAR